MEEKARFRLLPGSGEQQARIRQARVFGLPGSLGGDLIVQRELEKEADLAVVQAIESGAGRAHFQVYLDQENNRITIFSPAGKQLASLKVGTTKSPTLSGLDITNIRGDLRLEWLRIVRLDLRQEPPRRGQGRSGAGVTHHRLTKVDPVWADHTV